MPFKYVEIIAAWIGLYTAIKVLKFTKVYLEGDSSYAIDVISALLDQMNQSNPLLLDIKFWTQQCLKFTIKHIYREANKATDHVAKCAHNGNVRWKGEDHNLLTLEFFCKRINGISNIGNDSY